MIEVELGHFTHCAIPCCIFMLFANLIPFSGCIFSCLQRKTIREKYGLQESCIEDAICAYWCQPCILCQGLRETQLRNAVLACRYEPPIYAPTLVPLQSHGHLSSPLTAPASYAFQPPPFQAPPAPIANQYFPGGVTPMNPALRYPDPVPIATGLPVSSGAAAPSAPPLPPGAMSKK